MGFLNGLVSTFIEKLVNRITDEVILLIRKRMKMDQIDKEANELKAELAGAESAAEREAVLDKVHNLVNGFDGM